MKKSILDYFKPRREIWNRCDVCGRFIAYADFDTTASRAMVNPDTEEFETLCGKCNNPERRKAGSPERLGTQRDAPGIMPSVALTNRAASLEQTELTRRHGSAAPEEGNQEKNNLQPGSTQV